MKRFYRLESAAPEINMPYWFAKKEQPWSMPTDKPVKYRGNWYHAYTYILDSTEYLVISSASRTRNGYSEAIFFKLKNGDLTAAITVQDLLSEKINPEFNSEEEIEEFLIKKLKESSQKLYNKEKSE